MIGVKSRILVPGTAIMAMAVLAACGSAQSVNHSSNTVADAQAIKGRTLNVSTWGGHWTDTFKKWFGDPFEQDTGVHINYSVHGTDPAAPVLLQEKAHNVSIDLVDSGVASELTSQGYAAKFPSSLYSVLKTHSVPGAVNPYYLRYGTTIKMIVCNPKVMKRCPTNMKEFWDTKDFPGPRMMIQDPREMVIAAEEAAGVGKNALVPPNLGVAFDMLKKIKPSVQVWATSGDQQTQALASGQVGAAVMWETQLVPLLRDHPYLKASWNDAFTESDFSFVVPQDAPNADVAFAFLKWLALHPRQQAGFATDLGEFVPARGMLKYVPASLRSWMVQSHPGQVAFFDSSWFADHSDELERQWQSTIG